jgi:hypothetical protein
MLPSQSGNAPHPDNDAANTGYSKRKLRVAYGYGTEGFWEMSFCFEITEALAFPNSGVRCSGTRMSGRQIEAVELVIILYASTRRRVFFDSTICTFFLDKASVG